MAQRVKLDEVRAAALARVDRSERNFKLAFIGAGFVEVLFILSFILLADLSNRTHLLLLISTVSCYSIVVLGLFAMRSVPPPRLMIRPRTKPGKNVPRSWRAFWRKPASRPSTPHSFCAPGKQPNHWPAAWECRLRRSPSA